MSITLTGYKVTLAIHKSVNTIIYRGVKEATDTSVIIKALTAEYPTIEAITRLKHEFEDIVRTHIHNKISRSNCVELFLVEGEGKKVASMTKAFQKEEKMKSVRLIVI